jgi:hypothetical protein
LRLISLAAADPMTLARPGALFWFIPRRPPCDLWQPGGRQLAVGWHSGGMTGPEQPSLDDLVPELSLVREAGLEPLEVEPLVPQLPLLSDLGVVRHRTHTETALAAATAICQVTREAAERLADDPVRQGPADVPSLAAQAQMLFRVHYRTRGLTPGEARKATQEACGVGDRQYRARHESRLLRLVAQAVLDLDWEDDLHQWGRALEVGADVPQSVALYWLTLFRDHYFRLETSAYALQADLMTALVQLRGDLPSWRLYLGTAVYWNVEFSYLRQRFFRQHGPLWFAPTDEGATKLSDAAERIEYHDPFPDELMARLRRFYGTAGNPDHDDFSRRLDEAGLSELVIKKSEDWLRCCTCQGDGHVDGCEVGLIIRHCDILGDTVETEFERIQNWYRTPRFAADASLKDLILNYRTPGHERAGSAESHETSA